MQLPYANLQIKHQNPGASAPLVLPVMVLCNTSDEVIYGNIRENSKRPGKWVRALHEHGGVAVLCGSGPLSLIHISAYEKAVWANPVTRQKEIERLNAEAEAARSKKAQEEAAKAKAATAANIRNRDTQRTPTEPRATMRNLDDALRDSMREIRSRH